MLTLIVQCRAFLWPVSEADVGVPVQADEQSSTVLCVSAMFIKSSVLEGMRVMNLWSVWLPKTRCMDVKLVIVGPQLFVEVVYERPLHSVASIS